MGAIVQVNSMIFLESQRNVKRCMICTVLPPFISPFAAFRALPEMAFDGANGGTEEGNRRIRMKDDMAEHILMGSEFRDASLLDCSLRQSPGFMPRNHMKLS
jgi:hypothetical protein